VDVDAQGFRENQQAWEEFGSYVKEMVGEVALRWELLDHSRPEPWKKNIEHLHRCGITFQSSYHITLTWPWYSSVLIEISALVESQSAKREHRSTLRNFASYIRDPVMINGMKKKLDAALRVFDVCQLFFTDMIPVH